MTCKKRYTRGYLYTVDVECSSLEELMHVEPLVCCMRVERVMQVTVARNADALSTPPYTIIINGGDGDLANYKIYPENGSYTLHCLGVEVCSDTRKAEPSIVRIARDAWRLLFKLMDMGRRGVLNTAIDVARRLAPLKRIAANDIEVRVQCGATKACVVIDQWEGPGFCYTTGDVHVDVYHDGSYGVVYMPRDTIDIERGTAHAFNKLLAVHGKLYRIARLIVPLAAAITGNLDVDACRISVDRSRDADGMTYVTIECGAASIEDAVEDAYEAVIGLYSSKLGEIAAMLL